MKRFGLFIPILFLVVSCADFSRPAPTKPQPDLEPMAAQNYHLSDLRWESAKNNYGPFEKDSSNAGPEGGDGRTLTINGATFAKGLGMLAPAEIVYKLGGNCSTFSAQVGIDDLWNTPYGTVVFRVFADNTLIWDSGLRTQADPALPTGTLSMTGVQTLKLVITDGGNGSQSDFADWVDPVVTCDPAPPALAATNAHQQGSYGPLEPWPTVATHAVLLPDSTIISWYSMDTIGIGRDDNFNNQAAHNFTLVDIWNPNTNQHTNANNTSTDLFCAGFTPTADGNVFVAGGNLGSLDGYYYPGSVHTNIFNSTSKTWSRGPDMAEGRWYPTVVTLPNKEILIIGGWSNEQTTYNNYIPEIWNPATNTLRQLSNASTQGRSFQHLYPWMHSTTPSGKVFYAGPTATVGYLDTRGLGSWGPPVNRDGMGRLYGSSVMYQPSRLLIMGGGSNNNTAVTVNLAGGGIQVTPTGSMNSARTHLNATILPNGQVFINGGNTSGINFDDSTSVYSGEIWNPSTGTWQLMASADKPRNYHSVALLLPDGRVWTAGGGGCGTCAVNQQSAQIFYPPYLFKKDGSGLLADRPRITSATSTMSYNSPYTLLTDTDGLAITRVSLIPLGSVTHAFNMNQRYVTLPISSKTSGSISITSPTNSRIAPPGYYMLFVVNSSGVPSVARIVKVG